MANETTNKITGYLSDKKLTEQEEYLNDCIGKINNNIESGVIEVKGRDKANENEIALTTDTHGDLISLMGAAAMCDVKFKENEFLYYDRKEGIYYEKVDGKYYKYTPPYTGEKKQGEPIDKIAEDNSITVVPIPDVSNARELYHLGDVLDRGKESLTSLLLCEVCPTIKLAQGNHEFDIVTSLMNGGYIKETKSIETALARMKHSGKINTGYYDGKGDDVISYSHTPLTEDHVVRFFNFLNSAYMTDKYSNEEYLKENPPVVNFLDEEFKKQEGHEYLCDKVKEFLGKEEVKEIISNDFDEEEIEEKFFKMIKDSNFTKEEMLIIKNVIAGALIERKFKVAEDGKITFVDVGFENVYGGFEEELGVSGEIINWERDCENKAICPCVIGHTPKTNKIELKGNGKCLDIDDLKSAGYRKNESCATITNLNIETGKVSHSSFIVERSEDKSIGDAFEKNIEGHKATTLENFKLPENVLKEKQLLNMFLEVVNKPENIENKTNIMNKYNEIVNLKEEYNRKKEEYEESYNNFMYGGKNGQKSIEEAEKRSQIAEKEFKSIEYYLNQIDQAKTVEEKMAIMDKYNKIKAERLSKKEKENYEVGNFNDIFDEAEKEAEEYAELVKNTNEEINNQAKQNEDYDRTYEDYYNKKSELEKRKEKTKQEMKNGFENFLDAGKNILNAIDEKNTQNKENEKGLVDNLKDTIDKKFPSTSKETQDKEDTTAKKQELSFAKEIRDRAAGISIQNTEEKEKKTILKRAKTMDDLNNMSEEEKKALFERGKKGLEERQKREPIGNLMKDADKKILNQMTNLKVPTTENKKDDSNKEKTKDIKRSFSLNDIKKKKNILNFIGEDVNNLFENHNKIESGSNKIEKLKKRQSELRDKLENSEHSKSSQKIQEYKKELEKLENLKKSKEKKGEVDYDLDYDISKLKTKMEKENKKIAKNNKKISNKINKKDNKIKKEEEKKNKKITNKIKKEEEKKNKKNEKEQKKQEFIDKKQELNNELNKTDKKTLNEEIENLKDEIKKHENIKNSLDKTYFNAENVEDFNKKNLENQMSESYKTICEKKQKLEVLKKRLKLVEKAEKQAKYIIKTGKRTNKMQDTLSKLKEENEKLQKELKQVNKGITVISQTQGESKEVQR